MKERFKEKGFRPETLAVIEICEEILDEYAAEGYDLTLRQLYYQLVARDLFPASWADPKTGTKNRQKNYTRLGNIVNDARLAGLLDWDVIVDRGRETEANSHWSHPGGILFAASRWFTIDKWKDQPIHVEVMCEKQALEGVLVPVCLGLDVPFTSNKGYASQSFMYRKGKEIDGAIRDGKKVVVLYLGDHDPSGLDMDRDVQERLWMFAATDVRDVDVRRVALTMTQINNYGPPPNPAKVTDSRFADYRKKHGDESWELDALEPRVLADMVKRKIIDLRDEDLWDEAVNDEKIMKAELSEMAAKYDSKRWIDKWERRRRDRP